MKLISRAATIFGRTGLDISSRQLPQATIPTLGRRNASSLIDPNATTGQFAMMHKRHWNFGDVYAPHDISAAEMRKWGKRSRPSQDVFDILAMNPLSLYKNFSVMADFVSETGRIRPRSETGLRPVNQRRMAKAVRRAIALGLMPSTYKHPEILKKVKESPRYSR